VAQNDAGHTRIYRTYPRATRDNTASSSLRFVSTLRHRIDGELDPEWSVSPAKYHRSHKSLGCPQYTRIRIRCRASVFPPIRTRPTRVTCEQKKTMNSTGDQLASAPESELWGIVWLRYIAAVGFVILNYDCLLTLDDEVRLTFSYLRYIAQPYRLFPDSPCLARALLHIKRTVLHQSLSIHCYWFLFKLRSVTRFFLADPRLKRYQKLPAFTHHSPFV